LRYLAVLMSIVLHVLSVFILADFVLQNYEPEDTFDVELVTLSDTKICKEDAASVTASTHSKKILNPEQQAAVTSSAPYILVQAGPGTGKTLSHCYTQGDTSFQLQWEILYDW